MLDNERYNAAITSLGESIQSDSCISDHEINLQILLEQQLVTQQTLNRLGVDKSTLPKNIPGIETPICNQRVPRPSNVFVSLIGSPNTGRSSALERNFSSEADFGRVAYNAMKNLGKGKIDFNLLTQIQIMTAEVWHSHAKDQIYFDWMLGVENNTNVFFERDLFDLPFIRANFLFGRIDARVLKMAEEKFFDNLKDHPTTPKVIINTLIHPKASLERETELKTHNVVQLPFLEVLYEQNIRFHDEMVRYSATSTPSFNYLAVDMSKPNVDDNVSHLIDSINLMTRSFSKFAI